MVHLMLALYVLVSSSCCETGHEAAGKKASEVVPDTRAEAKTEVISLEMTSHAFEYDSLIPEEYTCDGEDVSPAIFWSGVPENTKSLALICDDPDAPSGVWVHWILYGIPPGRDSIPEAVAKEAEVLGGIRQGMTSFGRIGYGGPCPPKGKPHRYFFKLYALDVDIDLEPGKTKEDLLETMDGHILAEGQLMGRYGR